VEVALSGHYTLVPQLAYKVIPHCENFTKDSAALVLKCRTAADLIEFFGGEPQARRISSPPSMPPSIGGHFIFNSSPRIRVPRAELRGICSFLVSHRSAPLEKPLPM
jgi:hypothetical protein